MKEGYVALLDVLGFSALVGADDGGLKVRRYLECLQGATVERKVDYVVFSDSIVLIAKGNSPESLVAVAGACSPAACTAAKRRYSAKGCHRFWWVCQGSFRRKRFRRGSSGN